MNINSILIRPIITEKSMNDVSKGRFTFEVAKDADKNMVRKAVEEKFNVNVISVSTSILKGQRKRYGVRRIEKNRSPFKKATVTLKQGEKIDLFEVGGS